MLFNLQQVLDNMKNMQNTLSSTSQQLKQLKDGLRHFKRDKKSLEFEVNEVEKQYKQLKTKHQSVLKTLENKCNYWTMIDELLLKFRIKNNHIDNLTIIPLDSDTLAGKHLEAILKHLKVNIVNVLLSIIFIHKGTWYHSVISVWGNFHVIS